MGSCERIRIGVGLPTTVPGWSPELIEAWASEADRGPYTSLGVLDRVAYDSYDPLLALEAAAAVTERLRLATMVLAAPLRDTAELAHQSRSLNALSGGRLSLGVALGAREEDYRLVGADYRTRDRRLSQQLDELSGLWEESASIDGADRPQLLVGGNADQAFARVARYADGYAHGGGPPRAFAAAAARANAAWEDSGRPGRPQLWGQAYFALGDCDLGERYMRDYYAFTGPFVEKIANGMLRTPQSIVSLIRGYEDAGCDELLLFPTVASVDQLERLTDVVAKCN